VKKTGWWRESAEKTQDFQEFLTAKYHEGIGPLDFYPLLVIF
jgi:hypothetical protein